MALSKAHGKFWRKKNDQNNQNDQKDLIDVKLFSIIPRQLIHKLVAAKSKTQVLRMTFELGSKISHFETTFKKKIKKRKKRKKKGW